MPCSAFNDAVLIDSDFSFISSSSFASSYLLGCSAPLFSSSVIQSAATDSLYFFVRSYDWRQLEKATSVVVTQLPFQFYWRGCIWIVRWNQQRQSSDKLPRRIIASAPIWGGAYKKRGSAVVHSHSPAIVCHRFNVPISAEQNSQKQNQQLYRLSSSISFCLHPIIMVVIISSSWIIDL